MDTGNSPTTQLLTLLNVSAAKSTKRKRALGEQSPPSKLNKRRPVSANVQDAHSSRTSSDNDETPAVKEAEAENGFESDQASDVVAEIDVEDETQDPYEQHFGATSNAINSTSKETVDTKSWTTIVSTKRKLGSIAVSLPSGSSRPSSPVNNGLTSLSERLKEPFQELQAKLKPDQRDFQNDLLSIMSTYEDLYHTHQSLDAARITREAVTLHALNHVTKKRRRVLKNNERIVHATKAGNPTPENIQDQGFTRPSVLIVLSFRSSALNWFDALTEHTPSPSYQIENRARFRREFSLPEGVVDKLAVAEPGTYPRDHVETFKGNVDDNFRVGIKLTRKSVKLFSNFYGSDIILASPLGLRMSIEKEKNSDFLSSIEILIMDQMDALTMQNWEHVQFVMSHLNQLPKESRDTDFSRVKPWYLDGNAPYLRQSILFSAYETPEMRSLYNQTLKNVAGKVRTIRTWGPVQVPAGLEQNFICFDCSSLKDEPDKRFNYFTTQVLPAVMKSAVQSENTAIFIPSSFDFIRIHNYFKKQGYSFTVLSEYSSNQDISRARQALFNGKKSFLLISERFHFYRRYKIRGIRNLIFYGPPDHPQFYTEFLSFPFLDEGVETSDVTCRVLYSRYDWFKMERIAGTKGASQLIKQNSM
ncbi:digestive organ expansion factor [Dentipellis sp. KUC8613]|nr:digestive organ expansion factor [Dentipellis sp. KUC8613]